MRPKLLAQLIGLAVVIIAASWMTSSMLAQGRGKAQKVRPAAPPPRPIANADDGPTIVRDVVPEPRPGSVPAIPTARWSLKSIQVELQGPDLVVDGTLTVMDTRPDSQFYWSLRVVDAACPKMVFFHHVYQDQVFTVPLGETVPFTFHDRVRLNLGPGEYRVEWILNRFGEGETLNVHDDQWLRRHQVLDPHQNVTVPAP